MVVVGWTVVVGCGGKTSVMVVFGYVVVIAVFDVWVGSMMVVVVGKIVLERVS
jgi:hypothetical protein